MVRSIASHWETPDDVEQEILQFWMSSIAGNEFDMQDILAELNRLTLSDLVEFFDSFIAPDASERRVFASIIESEKSKITYDAIYPVCNAV